MNLKFTKLAQQILSEGGRPDEADGLDIPLGDIGFEADGEDSRHANRHAGLGATRYGVVVKWKGSRDPKWLHKKSKTKPDTRTLAVFKENEYEQATKAAATMKSKPNVEDAWVQELPPS